MMCAWDSLLEIVPRQMRQEVDRLGKHTLQELRLRINKPPELVVANKSIWLGNTCTEKDLEFCIQSASRYSPWSAKSIQMGYITAPGGHRIGLCGLTLYKNGLPAGQRKITSLCIRIARDYPGISAKAPKLGSVLILGAPGWGKTTLLRDLIRQRSSRETIAVVDERGELFPTGFLTGEKMDVLCGCRKQDGIEQVLRTMGPQCIAVDEITAKEDCTSILRAAGCGINLLATAHAQSIRSFENHPIYHSLNEHNVFDSIIMLKPDKTFTVERRAK